jgi:hypothetical protein
MPLDDGHMTETCCGKNIGGGEEELLRWRTISCLIKCVYACHYPFPSPLSCFLFLTYQFHSCPRFCVLSEVSPTPKPNHMLKRTSKLTAEHYLRGYEYQLWSHSIVSQHFTQPEDLSSQHARWVSFHITWRVLQLWRVTGNTMNKQLWTVDKGWSSSFGIEAAVNNLSPWKITLLRNVKKKN